MNRKRTAAECFAKAEAYEECAEHLGMAWTDDTLERNAGNALAKTLRTRAAHWRKIGQQRQFRIDSLVLEYCPNEMTEEQKEEWGLN